MMPIQKWSMKATSRKTGVHGASNMAAITGVQTVIALATLPIIVG